MKDVFIFDLDGTLCDCTHRLRHIQQGTPDWDAFYAACIDDMPKPDIIALARSLSQSGYGIYILTGRSAQVQAQTIDWLNTNEIPCSALIMRAEDDRRPDHELKLSVAQNLRLTPEDVVCVFEDRQRVVNMWRENGYTCCQVDAWQEHQPT